jgi:hypothetical protein
MKTQSLLVTLNVLTWIVFIGLLIKAGSMLFLLGYSAIKPDVAAYLYKGMDMIELRNSSFASYAFISVLLMTGPAFKAVIAYLMIGIFLRMNLESPFTMDIANRLRNVSFVLIGMWLLTIPSEVLMHGDDFNTEVLFVAGLTFIISQIFRRGVELQTENELTV